MQVRIAPEEFCAKSLHEIDFTQRHIQILHHLKNVHISSTEVRYAADFCFEQCDESKRPYGHLQIFAILVCTLS